MIKAENLTKQFDNIMALDHVSAEIKDGKCVWSHRYQWRWQEHLFKAVKRNFKTR